MPPPYVFAADRLTVVTGPCRQRGQCVASTCNQLDDWTGHCHAHYANDEFCELRPLQGVPVEVHYFETEAGFDVLTINGVAHSGSMSRAFPSRARSPVPTGPITWRSDSGITGRRRTVRNFRA